MEFGLEQMLFLLERIKTIQFTSYSYFMRFSLKFGREQINVDSGIQKTLVPIFHLPLMSRVTLGNSFKYLKASLSQGVK